MTQIEALRVIADNGPVTISEIPTSRNTVYALVNQKLVKRDGVLHTGTRGRPAKLYSVSAKGSRRLERAGA